MSPADLARLAALTPAERTAFRGCLLTLAHARPTARDWRRLDRANPAAGVRWLGERRRVHTLGAPRRRAADR